MLKAVPAYGYGLTCTGDSLNVFKQCWRDVHRTPTTTRAQRVRDNTTLTVGTTWLGVVPSSDTLCQSNRELTRETVGTIIIIC